MTMFLALAAVLLPIIGGLFAKKLCHKALAILTGLVLALNAAILFLPEAALTVWKFTDGLELFLRVDGISRLFGMLIAGTWLLSCVHAFAYLEKEENQPRYYRFFLYTEAALMLMVYAGNFMTFFTGFEAMTLLSMPLVIHEQTPEARSAAMKYLGFSVFGASAALLGFFVLNVFGFSTAFTPGGVLNPAVNVGKETLLRAIWLVMVIGFGAKAGLFPLHSWLPTAHPVAPSPASAALSGVITKCGVLAIVRVTYYLFGTEFLRGTWAQYVFLILTLITVFMGSMMALGEKLIKKRLAYSTVSQVSYVLFGLALMTEAGFVGAMLQAVFHMLAKNALFLWAGAVIRDTGFTRVDELRGLGRRMPAAMWGFVLAALSLIGIPPTSGFVSKWYLAQGALNFSGFGWGVVGVCVLIVSAILTAAYLLPVAAAAFFPGKDAYAVPVEHREPDWRMLLPILVLAVLTVVLGVFPGIVQTLIAPITALLF